MATIPVFGPSQQSYEATPQPLQDPASGSQAASTLAAAATQVSGAYAELSGRVEQNRRLADASSADASNAVWLIDQQHAAQQAPDPAAAPQQFLDTVGKQRDKIIAGIADPMVAQMVGENFNRRIQSHYASVLQTSLQRQNAGQLAAVQDSGSGYARAMSAAVTPDDWNLNLHNLQGAADAAVHSGLMNPLQQRTLISSSVRAALDLKIANGDAAGARAFLERSKELLSTSDLVGVTEHLAPKLKAQQADAAADVVFGEAVPAGPARGQKLTVPPQFEGMLNEAIAGTGIPRHVAAAMVQHESSWDPNTPGAAGEIGLGQVKPSTAAQPGFGLAPISDEDLRNPTRNLRFAVQYLAARGKAAGVTDWNDPAQAARGYAAYNSGSGKAQYARDVTATAFGGDALGAAPAAGPATFPDTSALIQRAEAMYPSDPEMQAAVVARVRHRISLIEARTATERSDMQRQFTDAMGALEAGKDDINIPTDRIRAVFPPPVAEQMIGQLNVARHAGLLFKSVQWAAPDEVAAARDDLATGLGPRSAMLRARTGGVGAGFTPGGGAVPDAGGDVTKPAETPEQFGLRTRLLAKFDQMVDQRRQALGTDPAAYVARNPDVAAKAAAIDANDPASFEAYDRASRAVQTQLGVPQWQQHTLTASQAGGMAGTITHGDAARTDAGAMLDRTARAYGAAWPGVFADLVTLGKLPAEYQVLAIMDAPAQAASRVDFQRVMAMVAQSGGAEKLRQAAPADAVRDIDKGIDDRLAPFRATVAVPGASGNVAVVANVKRAVEQLAQLYAMQGLSGDRALERATSAVLGRYDIDGTMRVPKGMLPVARTATDATLAKLQPADLDPVATQIAPEVPEATRREIMAAGARRAVWTANEDDSGLVALIQRTDGGYMPVTLKGGRRLELKFADMAGIAAEHPAPSPGEDATMQGLR